MKLIWYEEGDWGILYEDKFWYEVKVIGVWIGFYWEWYSGVWLGFYWEWYNLFEMKLYS